MNLAVERNRYNHNSITTEDYSGQISSNRLGWVPDYDGTATWKLQWQATSLVTNSILYLHKQWNLSIVDSLGHV